MQGLSKIYLYFLVLFVVSLIISVPGLVAAEAGSFASDDFNGCSLDTEIWTTFNQVTDPTVVTPTTNGSHMLFSVPGGTQHDLHTDHLEAPRILQAASDTDFELEVKFDSGLSGPQYQMQGIVIEQDDQNFLRFDFHSSDTKTRLYSASFEAGIAADPPQVHHVEIAELNVAPLYMRVKREGDMWTETYSFDGSVWLAPPGGVFTHALTVTAVGLFVGNYDNSPAHTAEVDYFFNTASPIVPEDGDPLLTVNHVGQGQVAKDPDQPAYACDQEVELTATADTGWLFDSWSGDLMGSTNPATLTITSSRVVTAAFTKQTEDEYSVYLPLILRP